ncbi:MAG TPA: MaoC family dehydratase [Bryobacteraceae bacterium]|nr:MaoC family dehydratase [Bryobacteraceae bacterium]
MPISLTIDQLRERIGQEAAQSAWITIEQRTIDAFAEVTGDHQWIHTDTKRAQTESPYRRTIAHGFLTLSLVSRLSNETVEIRGDYSRRINYGLNRVRFPNAVPEGARIRARFAPMSVEEVEGGHQVIWQVTVDVEGAEKPALAAEWLIRLYR